MMKNSFTRIATATPITNVADCRQNSDEIITIINKVSEQGADIILLPELCITSRSCGDLYTQPFLVREAEKALEKICDATKSSNSIIVVGAPVTAKNRLYNGAIVIYEGNIIGVSTQKAPTEKQFSPGHTLPEGSTTTLCGKNTPIGDNLIYSTSEYKFAIEIGNDIQLPCTASTEADIILNPAAEITTCGSNKKTIESLTVLSRHNACTYAHTNAGYGESTSTGVYAGYNAIYETGEKLADSKIFATDSHYSIADTDIEKTRKIRLSGTQISHVTKDNFTTIEINQKPQEKAGIIRPIDPTPFIPKGPDAKKELEEIFTIQSMALAKRIKHTWSKSCVIGISGGLDSTLALLVTAKACDIIGKPHSEIIAVTMPGFGTTDRTYNNAMSLMQALGVTIREISIKEACIQHFKDIEHNINLHDVTYENSQARERTQILMDIANQCSGIVVGTGDLSELALGWATYNGDHMSMYGVNASVPKTLIQHIVRWVAVNSEKKVKDILFDILDTPISPELIPADNQGNIKQKTEDLVGPYELHDFFLYNFMCYGYSPAKIYTMAQKAFEGNYDNATIKKWLTTFFRRFFTQQFKRSCMPDGPQTGACTLSPHGGWAMPSDTSYRLWIEECEKL